MNRYQSHKIVEAGKITSMTESVDGLSFDVGIEGDADPFCISKIEGDRILRMASESGLALEDGHLMVYKDNYVSWAPNHTMEDYELVQPSSGKSKIAGYRELTATEIENMNAIKEHGKKLGDLVALMRDNDQLDPRWISIGATNLQQGLMALTRAVAQPEFF